MSTRNVRYAFRRAGLRRLVPRYSETGTAAAPVHRAEHLDVAYRVEPKTFGDPQRYRVPTDLLFVTGFIFSELSGLLHLGSATNRREIMSQNCLRQVATLARSGYLRCSLTQSNGSGV